MGILGIIGGLGVPLGSFGFLWGSFGVLLGFLWGSFGVPLGFLWDSLKVLLTNFLLCLVSWSSFGFLGVPRDFLGFLWIPFGFLVPRVYLGFFFNSFEFLGFHWGFS